MSAAATAVWTSRFSQLDVTTGACVSSPLSDMLACAGMQALQRTAVSVGLGQHSTVATTRSSSSGQFSGHRGVPVGSLPARHISKQRSFPCLALQSPQYRQRQPWRRQVLAAPQATLASAGNGSSAGVQARDSSTAEATYADFDWRDQWYPVAFVRDMPEGAHPRVCPDESAAAWDIGAVPSSSAVGSLPIASFKSLNSRLLLQGSIPAQQT